MNAHPGIRPDDVVEGYHVLKFRRGEFDFQVAGTDYYEDAVTAFIGRRPADEEEKVGNKTIYLVRDPHNVHDPNAIQVWSGGHGMIGYAPRSMAEILAPAIDNVVEQMIQQTGLVPAVRAPASLYASWSEGSYYDDDDSSSTEWELEEVEITVCIGLDVEAITATKAEKPSKFPGVISQPTVAQAVAAGWYTDPTDPSQNRYWDGATWTEHRSPR